MELSLCEGRTGWMEFEGKLHPVWGEGSKPLAKGRCTLSEGFGPLEHLSAAALCQGVHGWVLRVEHRDLPIFDGSAKIWQQAFAELAGADGFQEQIRVEPVGIGAMRWTSERGGGLEIEPSNEFRLTVEWTDGPDGREIWEGGASNLHEILVARTFVVADDWLAARKGGFLKGTDPASGRLLRGSNPSLEALDLASKLEIDWSRATWTGGDARLENECAAHKAMDLVGDIGCWIGYLPNLNIQARDAGHDLHHQLGSALRGYLGEVRGTRR